MIGALDLNGTVFSYYVENFLMKHLYPGISVIPDSSSPHKNDEALNLIEKSRANILFLPSYRSDPNPIGFCRSKIKNFLSRLKIRTAEELYRGYADSLKLINSEMAAACFRHCGL